MPKEMPPLLQLLGMQRLFPASDQDGAGRTYPAGAEHARGLLDYELKRMVVKYPIIRDPTVLTNNFQQAMKMATALEIQ